MFINLSKYFAQSLLCVATMIILSFLIDDKNWNSLISFFLSGADVGSSSKIKSGSLIIDLIKASLCISPPDKFFNGMLFIFIKFFLSFYVNNNL